MRIVDFETYATERGASRYDLGDAGLHKSTARMGRSTWKRNVLGQMKKDSALAARRAELLAEYDAEVSKGNIRPPAEKERLMAVAAGHDDNAAVQAARRLLEKRKQR